MKSYAINLSKDDTLIIKGIAIVLIILHNYFHHFQGIVAENEFDFDNDSFYNLWNSFSDSIGKFIIDFVSFYGHYGVTAFFFLSGYGLALKYKETPLEKDFIRNCIKKLWRLFLPILACFVILAIFKALITEEFFSALEHIGIILVKAFCRITFTTNLFMFDVFWISGPWWFFSVIFQLYIIYKYIFSKYFSPFFLVGVALLMISIQIILYFCQIELIFSRFNAIAWIPSFILGLLFAKYKIRIYKPVYYILFIICFIIDCTFLTWIFGYSLFPFVFIVLRLIMKKCKIDSIFIFIGKLSPYLFVTNTFVRTFVYSNICSPDVFNPSWFILLIGFVHLIICFIIALSYKKISMYLYKMLSYKRIGFRC